MIAQSAIRPRIAVSPAAQGLYREPLLEKKMPCGRFLLYACGIMIAQSAIQTAIYACGMIEGYKRRVRDLCVAVTAPGAK